MTLFAEEDLTRLEQDGEDLFFQEFHCIIDRLSIAITSGTSEYTLADHVHSIRRVTWYGREVLPMTHREYRDGLEFVSSTGRVDNYIFTGLASQTIKFHRTPGENISLVAGDLYNAEQIADGVVIEYWRSPDYSTYILPPFFRNRLLRTYVNKRKLELEGKSQNLKASKYFESKWNFQVAIYKELMMALINRPRRLVDSGPREFYGRNVARPILPDGYLGVSVDEGD